MRKVQPIAKHEAATLPKLLTVEQAAAYIGVSRSFLDKARSEGAPGGRTEPPLFVRVNGRCLYRVSDLNDWVAALEARRVG